MEGSNSVERCSEMSSDAARVAAGVTTKAKPATPAATAITPAASHARIRKGLAPPLVRAANSPSACQAPAGDQHREHQRERRGELGEFRQAQTCEQPQGVRRIPSEGGVLQIPDKASAERNDEQREEHHREHGGQFPVDVSKRYDHTNAPQSAPSAPALSSEGYPLALPG